MINRTLIALFVLLGACSSAACAADQNSAISQDKVRAIHQLLELTHANANAKSTAHAMVSQVAAIYERQHQITDDQKRVLLSAVNDYVDQSMLDSGKLEDIVTGAYAQHFTLDEIHHLTAFYRTPTGQKTIQEMPSLTHQIIQQVGEFSQQNHVAMQSFIRSRFEAAGYDMGARQKPHS